MLLKDIMTKNVVTLGPEVSLIEGAETIFKHDFDGLPIVDADNRVVGILTQYDMVAKGSAIHLPTFQKIITEMQVYKKDKASMAKDFQEVLSLKIKDVMNNNPLTLNQDTDIDEVIRTFSEHHKVNPIPVIDDNGRLVGVMSRFDIMRLFIKTSEEAKKLFE